MAAGFQKQFSFDEVRSMEDWYLSIGGVQEGPLSRTELLAALRRQPDRWEDAMVWTERTADWVTLQDAGLVPELEAPKVSIPAPTLRPGNVASSPAPVVNPYLPPASNIRPLESTPPQYPGINRITYWISSLILSAGMFGWGFLHQNDKASIETSGLALFVIFIISMILTVYRARNVGKSGWWVLTIFIPIYSLWTNFVLIAAPAGYEDTRKLDLAAKIMVGIIIAMLLLAGLGLFVSS